VSLFVSVRIVRRVIFVVGAILDERLGIPVPGYGCVFGYFLGVERGGGVEGSCQEHGGGWGGRVKSRG
jgi:hypothetical protein